MMWGHRDNFSVLESYHGILGEFLFKVSFFHVTGWVGGHINSRPPPKEIFKLTFTLGKCLFNLVILTFNSGALV